MTINDMLADGVVFQGNIKVMQYDPLSGDHLLVHSCCEDDGWMVCLKEPWADCQVGYIYSPYGQNGMTIEVGEE